MTWLVTTFYIFAVFGIVYLSNQVDEIKRKLYATESELESILEKLEEIEDRLED